MESSMDVKEYFNWMHGYCISVERIRKSLGIGKDVFYNTLSIFLETIKHHIYEIIPVNICFDENINNINVFMKTDYILYFIDFLKENGELSFKERIIDLLIPMKIIQKNLGYANQEEFDKKINSFPWESIETEKDEFVLHIRGASTADIKGTRENGVPLYNNEYYINAKYLKPFLGRFSGIPHDDNIVCCKILEDFFGSLEKND